MKKIILYLLAVIPVFSFAQEEQNFGIKFSGFVKNDMFFDTRQVITAREGHFLLYPTNVNEGTDGNDLNKGFNFNILAIQARLKGAFTGPDAFGAKTSGILEGAFFGHSNADVNGFRLRNAFAKLKWENAEFLAGQYWHPMFVTDCFPGVVSFNTGVPFQPFSRAPQLRFTKNFGNLNLLGAVLSERDFTSNGPGGASSNFLRNSGIPEVQVQLQYKKEGDNSTLAAGIGGGFLNLKPRLNTDSSTVAKETISGISQIAYLKFKTKSITFKLEEAYGQNLYNKLMLGGYSEYKYNATNGEWSYITNDVMSVWTELHTNGKKMQVGVFGGYTINLGATDSIGGAGYTRGGTIASLLRVSPRVVWISGKTKIATEVEYTSAAYAKGNANGTTTEELTGIDNKGKVTSSEAISNIRLLFSVIHSF